METFKSPNSYPKTLKYKTNEFEDSARVLASPPLRKTYLDQKQENLKQFLPLPLPLGLRPSGSKLHIRQPFKILVDIWGVLTSYNFRAELFSYIEANLATYLAEHFEDSFITTFVADVGTRTAKDVASYPDMPPVNVLLPKREVLAAVVANLTYRRKHHDSKKLMLGLDSINNQIWNEAYAAKLIQPHLFPDVLANFNKWANDPLYIKIYTFASGPPHIQKLFLSACIVGDPTKFIVTGFDAHHRYKYDPIKYRGVIASLAERDPRNLFYLTDSPKKAQAAREAGMTAFVVLREGNRKYREQDLAVLPLIESFDEFDFYEFAGDCC